jgi:GT2 family glycosyltransferase
MASDARWGTEPRILIISSVRNEAAHIERVAAAVNAQELPPARWLVIDDDSTDDTLSRLRKLEASVPFLTVLSADPAGGLNYGHDRLARAPEVRNFYSALRRVDLPAYSHVMKLDGDIELPPHYLRVMLQRFKADRELGIAGGVLVEPQRDGSMRDVPIPRHHVHGALKLYTRECFEAIGGIQERLGWDTIDQTYARMRGYRTVSYEDLVCVHHRPIASGDGALRGRARHGECAYILDYTWSWVALRSTKVAVVYPPYGISGAAFLYGYARAAAKRTPRVEDPEFRRFTRSELRSRMTGAPGRYLIRRRPKRSPTEIDPASAR